MINYKKLNPVVTELFIRGKKLNTFLLFLLHNHILKYLKKLDLIQHFFIMEILNKRELQQIALNHSSDVDFKDFIKIYQKYAVEPYSF